MILLLIVVNTQLLIIAKAMNMFERIAGNPVNCAVRIYMKRVQITT